MATLSATTTRSEWSRFATGLLLSRTPPAALAVVVLLAQAGLDLIEVVELRLDAAKLAAQMSPEKHDRADDHCAQGDADRGDKRHF